MTTLVTTAEEVLQRFNVTDNARRRFDRWSTGHRRDRVVPVVMAHRTKTLYTLTRKDVDRVRDRRGHALGEITRAEGERIGAIVDWSPDFAFTHVFHYALESLGHLPTWPEFREFSAHDETACEALWVPAQRKVAEEVEQFGRDAAYKAMRWRVGKAYYSFVREVHLIICLHARGIDVRFHPLADALFRVDAWWGATVVSLYIRNDEYRSGRWGRKDRPEEILAGSAHAFRFETIDLEAADKFGVVYLVREEDIDRVAERLVATRPRRHI